MSSRFEEIRQCVRASQQVTADTNMESLVGFNATYQKMVANKAGVIDVHQIIVHMPHVEGIASMTNGCKLYLCERRGWYQVRSLTQWLFWAFIILFIHPQFKCERAGCSLFNDVAVICFQRRDLKYIIIHSVTVRTAALLQCFCGPLQFLFAGVG